VKILFTGASSFTGSWIAERLLADGHHLVAPLRRTLSRYDELRRARMARLGGAVEIVEDCPLGSPRFMALIEQSGADLLCHHGAQVDNYRADDFDIAAALRDNTANLPDVLRALRRNPRAAVILTGSVFEQNEGKGSEPRLAFSPYGLSKGATADVFRFWCRRLDVKFAKFVVPNPFGPFEEPRFCDFLLRHWTAGKTPEVKTPAYTRDNIHASLLAAAYADMINRIDGLPTEARLAPSLYAETQGAFAERFAREIGERLGLDCPLNLAEQTDFPEPMVRVNTDPLDHDALGWSESEAWDELAGYYRGRYLAR
jgi:nucleoside-diphosphate-sugar epimerase